VAGKGPGADRLPALDLSDEELLGLRPAGSGAGATPRPPPPPANAAPTAEEIYRRGAGPNLELDVAGEVFLTSRYRPPAFGVLCGERPDTTPTDEQRAEALKIANYGPVPPQFMQWGMYSWRVLKRQVALKKEIVTLRQLAAVSHGAYEKAVANVAEKARQIIVRGGKKPPVDQVERIQLAFRVLEDVRGWGPEMEPARREVEGLQAIYEKRLHAAEMHELAIASVDARVFKLGLLLYVGGTLGLLLLIFSPVIYRSIFPPDLPTLPPEP